MAYKPNQGGGAAEKGLFSTVKYIYLYCHSGYNDEWYHWRSSFCPGHAQQTVDKVWTTSRWSASSTCLPPFVHLSDLDHDLSTDNIWHTLLDLLSTPRCPFSPEPPRISKNLLIPQNGGRFPERFRKSLLPNFNFLKCWMFILITTYVGFSSSPTQWNIMAR